MTPRGVVFDFDGVVADTEALHLRAYQDILGDAPFELTRDAYFARYLGFDDVGVFTELARDHDHAWSPDQLASLIERKGRRYDELLGTEDVVFPAVPGCVARLSETLSIGIASGALHDEIEHILERARLRDRFSVIVAADDVEQAKPAPDVYLAAVRALTGQTEPDWGRFVAIEDSQWGLASARAAGLRRIGVTTSYPADALTDAEVIVDDLSSVDTALVDRLCRSS